MSDYSAVLDAQKKNAEGIASLRGEVKSILDTLKRTPAGGHTKASDAFGVPWARTGEDPMSSRGFSFMKMVGVMAGQISPDEAKVEIDISNRLNQVLVKNMGAGGYRYGGLPSARGHQFLAPLATNFLHEEFVDRNFRNEMKSLVAAGTDGADTNHMAWIKKKQLTAMGYGQKDLSWLDTFVGGALVPPAEQGELIEWLRNKEALVNAGARTVPLPPQGRLLYPRQTAASSTYWVGENARIQSSDIGTGEMLLSAKKLAVLIKAPNELLRFASPAAEALMRDDMTKSLALALDLAGLEGLGGDTRSLGIINRQNINRVTSSTPGGNGDTVVGQDIYRMIAIVEEQNAEFEGWIMRPKMLYKYYQLRADAVAQGDAGGVFLFNLIREAGDGVKPMIGGFPVTKSTQVSQVRSKGNASNLTYVLGGMFSDVLIGMFGAIEFAATTQGDTAFQNDQTWVRGILSTDTNVRHEVAFALMDNLIVNAA